MYEDGGRVVLSPSDLVNFLACRHLTEQSVAVARGLVSAPVGTGAEIEVARRRGLAHEQAYLDALESQGVGVGIVAEDLPLDEKVALTKKLLSDGTPVVYQGAFLTEFDGRPSWRGHADFLRRVETPSALGSWSYEPLDTKLARRIKPSAVLQLCEYAEQLEALQGDGLPVHVHVILGGNEPASLRRTDFSAYLRAAKRRLEVYLAAGGAAYPWPVEFCSTCDWRTTCDERRLADDHLTVVAGLTGEQARRLTAQGIPTVSGLAASTRSGVPKMGAPTFERLRQQARLQVAAREAPGRPPPYELLRCDEPGIGLGGLPRPSAGDLFFDIEADPFAEDGGLEYLLGVGWMGADGFAYRAFWGHDRGEEKLAFEAFVDFVIDRHAEHPDLHVYHYAPYEPAALGRLMGRHATREEEVDELLRGDVLVDLYQVVRRGVRVGTPSYSLKKLEALYMLARTEVITDGGSSIAEYERWIETGEPSILDDLARYNRVDCDSTRLLRGWLEGRRAEYAGQFGEPPPRPPAGDSSAPEGAAEAASETAALKEALAERADARVSGSPAQHAAWILGELLDWYRREDKPEWWRYYDRLGADEEQLFADTEAVTGLWYDRSLGPLKRSVVERYHFDPAQEHKLSPGQRWVDPDAERRARAAGARSASPGEITRVDPASGTVELKRSPRFDGPHPVSLIPGGPLQTTTQREALRKVARFVVEHGIDDPGQFRAVRDLLLRCRPRLRGGPLPDVLVPEGRDAAAAVVDLAGGLDGGCLAVQGPPGSGKTRTAARAVVELVRSGRTVGITANSHAVIAGLLRAVVDQATRDGVALRAAQKAGDGREVADPCVLQCQSVPDLLAALRNGVDVIAGTAWVFSDPAFEAALDHLVVDEAGQFSLASAVAVGTSARNLLLVGDPRQLSQPSKGTHPDGVGVSALQHFLGGTATMPPEQGVFMPTTHRLHPDICRFVSDVFYEGRLISEPGCERQAVDSGPLQGSGLRWLPVRHEGNRTSSEEEAEAVAACVGALVGHSWTDRQAQSRPLTADDVLVVAPYNAQVAQIRARLGDDAPVGTVDKFQGRQAPVVIVSLAASSAEDVARGMEFLFSGNRLNVAVSRAQALTVIVGAPSLLAAHCRTVGQLRLVNGFCRYVELAADVSGILTHPGVAPG